MKSPSCKGITVLIVFFLIVLAVSLYASRPFYPLALAGESSVGTWLSGVLLVLSAAFCLIIGLRQKTVLWFGTTAFLLLLALDERFMFHEQMKERLVFIFHSALNAPWLCELPVLFASAVGVCISFLLWKEFTATNRVLLGFTVGLGLVSVAFDVWAAGVLIEECAKLFAELILSCALVRQVETEVLR